MSENPEGDALPAYDQYLLAYGSMNAPPAVLSAASRFSASPNPSHADEHNGNQTVIDYGLIQEVPRQGDETYLQPLSGDSLSRELFGPCPAVHSQPDESEGRWESSRQLDIDTTNMQSTDHQMHLSEHQPNQWPSVYNHEYHAGAQQAHSWELNPGGHGFIPQPAYVPGEEVNMTEQPPWSTMNTRYDPLVSDRISYVHHVNPDSFTSPSYHEGVPAMPNPSSLLPGPPEPRSIHRGPRSDSWLNVFGPSEEGLDRGHLDVPPPNRTRSVSSGRSFASDMIYCNVPDCTASFSGKHGVGNFGRHRRQKHRVVGPEEHRCEAEGCDKTFQRKDSRLKHYRKYHPHLA